MSIRECNFAADSRGYPYNASTGAEDRALQGWNSSADFGASMNGAVRKGRPVCIMLAQGVKSRGLGQSPNSSNEFFLLLLGRQRCCFGAEHEPSGDRSAPFFDAPLQSSQLAWLERFRHCCLEPLKNDLGSGIWLLVQPLLDKWPDILTLLSTVFSLPFPTSCCTKFR